MLKCSNIRWMFQAAGKKKYSGFKNPAGKTPTKAERALLLDLLVFVCFNPINNSQIIITLSPTDSPLELWQLK